MNELDFTPLPLQDLNDVLAYLYVQKKNYDELTPEKLASDFMSARGKIRAYLVQNRERF